MIVDQEGEEEHEREFWFKPCWSKEVPWKMSFLAWRVFKRKISSDDNLRRFGYQLASRCYCCPNPGLDNLQHIFYTRSTASQVWGYFARSLGFNIQIRGVKQLCYEWWKKKPRNRMIRFLTHKLPVVILWELWVHYNQCKYGKESPSRARIIFKVTRDMVDCIMRKWPSWDPFPPNWNYILRRADLFKCSKIVREASWCKPPKGWIKINTAVKKGSCSFMIRNSKGEFVMARVYSGDRDMEMIMLKECLSWCKKRGLGRVQIEGEQVRVDGDEQGLRVEWLKCDRRVNCIAQWLLDKCEGQNVVYRRGPLLEAWAGNYFGKARTIVYEEFDAAESRNAAV
ncbi:uncharacterized protein LOC116024311 [Ipomoea triloba]|uniref:uncharacterized protein LOC116024311 n=1 Tax=Ipomoea triloba TaxID=35885 RepID=UPI00125E86BF|nr:uncharacterized protein LOC116024311 [Ipomoea triloba]